MLGLETIFEFSRSNCVAICSFLVPANLIATGCTLILSAMARPLIQLKQSVAIAAICAIALFLHISTWFIIGVVTPVTFILLTLGTTCFATNLLAITYRQQLSQLVANLTN